MLPSVAVSSIGGILSPVRWLAAPSSTGGGKFYGNGKWLIIDTISYCCDYNIYKMMMIGE